MGKINQQIGNKMGGFKTNDLRAHGTQKTRTEATCSHNKSTNTWPANKSPAMCKTRHEHAANENIL